MDAAKLDKYLIRDTRQQAEDTNELVVTYNGIPQVLGHHRDGDPVWGIKGGADTPAFHDTRIQPIVLDETAITLATTQKALWPYARTQLPANYFVVGKTVWLKVFGKATTDGTGGNYTSGIGYGSSDAPAAALGASTTNAGVASKSNISWWADAYVTCRTIGASGTLVGWGLLLMDLVIQLSTTQPNLIPASALTAVSVDTTAGTNSPVVTLQRSGAGVWTATTQAIIFSALN